MNSSEQRKMSFRYAEVLRFIQMRKNGGYYMSEDVPSFDELYAEKDAMDLLFSQVPERPAQEDKQEEYPTYNALRYSI